jgi:hypothetical protein
MEWTVGLVFTYEAEKAAKLNVNKNRIITCLV